MNMKVDPDPLLRCAVLAATERPQTLVWRAMHQDYSERFCADEEVPSEEACGETVVKHLLQGDKGHYGPLEHPSITFNIGYFPHSVMQQARTHRVGVSFDCQSMRYTGSRIARTAKDEVPLDEVFYVRPVGHYHDRQGKHYFYSERDRLEDLTRCLDAAKRYGRMIEAGMAEEHARGMLPFDFRQHFVVSFNARSLMHFLDLRAKADAQLEIRWLCEKMVPKFRAWMPQVAAWYCARRLHCARLAP